MDCTPDQLPGYFQFINSSWQYIVDAYNFNISQVDRIRFSDPKLIWWTKFELIDYALIVVFLLIWDIFKQIINYLVKVLI